VDHKPNVLFVDAHSESDGRNDYMNLSFHPFGLNFLSLTVGEIGMVKIAWDFMVNTQVLGQFFAIFPAQAVYYT
jgi:prepilin-type processing-associated H-X9-DG protein